MTAERPRRVTQRDVARLASVSQTTVSLVLSGAPTSQIPAETLERVQAAMRELGYVPNRWARALKTNKTMTLACVVPDIANPFYPSLLRGMQSAADHAGYDVITVNTDGAAEREQRFLNWSLEGRVDGVVGVFFTLRVADFQPLTDAGIGVVRIESSKKKVGPLPVDNLYIDNEAAAGEVTRYLIRRGYRRIAMIAGLGGPQEGRLNGYEAALLEAGRKPLIVADEAFNEEGGFRAAQQLFALPARPDAIFAANDMMAIGAMAAAHEAGLAVPGDVAIAGFDDIFAARLVTPALTTISQFQYDLGTTAAEVLLDRLQRGNAGPGTSQAMPFRLIERSST
ncbi:MAG TPA: LacI family DNA-binding transcriptional regulator [Kaistia sp.]|nr:LacI family DNA-binding transcriptional regulator [Kaistia sp.]